METWNTPFLLDLTAAHSILAPFKSMHSSILLVAESNDGPPWPAEREFFDLQVERVRLIGGGTLDRVTYADSLNRNRNRSVRTTHDEDQLFLTFLPFSVSFVLCRTPWLSTRCQMKTKSSKLAKPMPY